MDKLKNILTLDQFESLVRANFKTLICIIRCKESKLAETTKLDIQVVRKVQGTAAKLILKDRIHTADQLNEWFHISFGCPTIDSITRGGVALNGINEVYGYSGSGKTQLCLQLSLITQLPSDYGGLGKGVIYISTEDAFPSKRFHELAEIYQEKYNQIRFEDNIFLEHIADYHQLNKLLSEKLPKFLQYKQIGLIIIDSIAGVFRSENLNVNYLVRSQEFMNITRRLLEFSDKFQLGIICVNQVTDDVISGQTVPCLGLAWSSLIKYRFHIARNYGSDLRTFEVIFGPDLPDKQCKFRIVREGIVGV